MKKVFLFLMMFLVVGAYGNNGAIESSIVTGGSMLQETIRHPDFHHLKNNILVYEIVSEASIRMKKEIQCMAKNIFYEAASESTAGRLAVAQVTLNRVKSTRFPNTVCEVIYQGPHWASGHPKRDRCQFSWYCDGLSDEPRDSKLWSEAQELAKHVFQYEEEMVDITDGATHYHASWMEKYPKWSQTKKVMASIDQHIFYGARVSSSGF